MTALYSLAKWREGTGLNRHHAAHHLRMDPARYAALEDGEIDVDTLGPSFIIDLFQKTGVLLTAAAEPSVPASPPGVSSATGAEPGGSGTETDPSVLPRAWARRGQVWVALDDSEDDAPWVLSPKLAGRLGMEMIRAAFEAMRLEAAEAKGTRDER